MSYSNLVTVYTHAILPVITYAAESWSTSISRRAKHKLQQIQRSFLIFTTKAYRTISQEALSAISGIMPLDLATHLYEGGLKSSRPNNEKTNYNST